jgi:hypothetical protein
LSAAGEQKTRSEHCHCQAQHFFHG